ncbi:MAG: TonB terminal [Verrucomicrobiota bacterium]
MHALLFVIILVAPAFLPEKPRPHTPVLNLVSARELDIILRASEAPPAPAPIPSPAPTPAPTAPAPVPAAPAAPAVVEPAPAPKVVEPPRPPAPTPKLVEPPKVVVKATPPPTPKAPKELPKRETVKEPATKTAKVEPRPLPVTAKGKEAPAKKDTKKSKEPEPPPTKTTSAKSTSTKPAIKLADTSHLTSRHAEADTKAKQRADAEERDQSVAAARAAQQAHLQHVEKMKAILGGVQGGLSSPVDINIDAGGGPNAAAFLDYGQMMVRIYEQMWLVPPNLSDSLAIVGVTVTVARNGRVLEWHLPKPSGNSAIDKSVRETLQKVIQFEPFPASFREAQRTFNIDFNLKAKRTTG